MNGQDRPGAPLSVVVDAVAVRPGSAAIVGEQIVRAWAETFPDTLTVLVSGSAEQPFPVPDGVTVTVARTLPGPAAPAWERTWSIRRACRAARADLLISLVTASALVGAPCVRGVVVHDLRHEVMPAGFSPARRLSRKMSYGVSFRGADVLLCNSRRTRTDLLRRRPGLAGKAHVVPFGGDHVQRWQPAPGIGEAPYAVAFGSFANKNVESVIRAWWHLSAAGEALQLRIVGIPVGDRPRLADLVAELRLEECVTLLPWLDATEFAAVFAGASVVVFPSAFEGFGLPALEALALRTPLVVSDDPALVEVCDGHATVLADVDPATIAEGVRTARARSADELAAAADHVRAMTWQRTVGVIRGVLLEAAAGRLPRFGP